MGREHIEDSLAMEMKRGTLVLCVLLLADEPFYGYSLVSEMQKKGVDVEANTLYPLLRRLSSQGLLSDSWDTSQSKPRKYYQITNVGKEVRTSILKTWTNMADAVENMTASLKKKK